MTQSSLAAKAGMSPSGLSQLVHGTSRASMSTVLALSSALECDPGTLFPEVAHFGERHGSSDEVLAESRQANDRISVGGPSS